MGAGSTSGNINITLRAHDEGSAFVNKLHKSEKLFEEARKTTPAGVHSAIRFFDPYPIFISRAKGAKIYDADGNEYLDYHLGFGPVILGHSNPRVNAAVREQLDKGAIFGLSNELEVRVAKKITHHVPSAEMIRFCSSGTEATYHAIRAARAYTGKNKIVKFEGAYHGWHDYVSVSSAPALSDAGPVESPTQVPDSEGLSEVAKNTIVVPYNRPEILERTTKQHRNEIAAVITEPILHGNATCIPPRDGFLTFLREVTAAEDILLIFDEIVTGFRHDLGGAQKLFGVKPDLTTFAKAMANGFPVGAVCGATEIMSKFKPTGNVDYGGTYNGNPISMTATLATIEELETGRVYEHLFDLGQKLRDRLNKCVVELGLKAQAVGFGSVFQLLFTDKEICDYRDTLTSSKELFMKFQRGMMDEGIFMIPQPNKRCHISAAHTIEDVDRTVETARKVLTGLRA